MAITFDTKGLMLNDQDSPVFSYLVRYLPEAASETFPEMSPVVFSSGYVSEAATSPATSIMGIALTAGNDDSAAGTSDVEVVLATEFMMLEANLLEASAANHTLVATDLGSAVDLEKSTTLLGASTAGWYFKTPADSNGSVVVCEFNSSIVQPTQERYKPAVDDINARVRARIRASVLAFD